METLKVLPQTVDEVRRREIIRTIATGATNLPYEEI